MLSIKCNSVEIILLSVFQTCLLPFLPMGLSFEPGTLTARRKVILLELKSQLSIACGYNNSNPLLLLLKLLISDNTMEFSKK